LQEYGVSVHGLSNILNSVFDFYFTGKIKKNPRWYDARCYSLRPVSTWATLDIIATIYSGISTEVEKLLRRVTLSYAQSILQGMILTKLGLYEEVGKCIEAMLELTSLTSESFGNIHDGLFQNGTLLRNRIDTLAEMNTGSFDKLIYPVGKSCSQIFIGHPTSKCHIVLGEVEAFVMSVSQQLIVCEPREYKGILTKIGAGDRSFEFRDLGSDVLLAGRIVDPTFRAPKNAYKKALQHGKVINVSMKSVTRNGKIVQSFILAATKVD
jgi:hypothetical protein